MNHQPYETWIFTQEDLDQDQAKELQVHLKLCERCKELASASAQVETQLMSSTLVGPATGFTARWRERMAERRYHSHRRQNTLLFGALSLGTLILSVPLFIHFVIEALSPGNVVSEFVQDFVNWLAVIGFTGDVTAGVVDGMVDTIPAIWWLSVVFILTGLCSLWLFVMHRIRPKREVLNQSHINGS